MVDEKSHDQGVANLLEAIAVVLVLLANAAVMMMKCILQY